MCFLCDGGTIEDLERLIAAHIIEPGWHVAGVEGAGRDASWAYTIGLLERFDHPELIVTGCCCGPCAMACVNSLAASVRDGARYAVGDRSSCLDGEVQVLFGAVPSDPVALRLVQRLARLLRGPARPADSGGYAGPRPGRATRRARGASASTAR